MFAFATLDVCNVPLMDAVAALVLQEGYLAKSEPWEIASVVWAFGKLEVYNRQLLCAASSHMQGEKLFNDLTDQSIANFVWAFANVGPFLPPHPFPSLT